jgi:uncharacterized protein
VGNPVAYFEILTRDPQELRAFYRDAFGWEIGEAVPGSGIADYTLVQTDGRGIPGGIGALPANGYNGHVTFYIEVPDIALAFDEIEARGGTRMMGPDQVPNGPIIGLFKDPAGHTIGLFQNSP